MRTLERVVTVVHLLDPVTQTAIGKITSLALSFGEKRVRGLWDKGAAGRVLLFLHAEFATRTGKTLEDLAAIHSDQLVREQVDDAAAGKAELDMAALEARFAEHLTGVPSAESLAAEMAARVPGLIPFVADGTVAEVEISRQLSIGFEGLSDQVSALSEQIAGLDAKLEGLVLSTPAQPQPGTGAVDPSASAAASSAARETPTQTTPSRTASAPTPASDDVTSAIARALLDGPLERAGQRQNAQRAAELLGKGDAAPAAELLVVVADALDAHGLLPVATAYRRQAAEAFREAGETRRARDLLVHVIDSTLERLSEEIEGLVWRLEQLLSPEEQWLALGFRALDAFFEQPDAAIAQLADVLDAVDDPDRALEWRARLVEMLVLRERWDEAADAAEAARKITLRAGARLRLELDYLDALGRLGRDDDAWADALEWADATTNQAAAAHVHQRYGVSRARADDPDEAGASFMRAAATWSRVPGAEDQVAEAYFSSQTAARLQAEWRTEGSELRPLAAALRGSTQTPAARAEAHEAAGMHARILEQLPRALRGFWAAFVEHHRVGNLRGMLFEAEMLGELYTKAAEPAEAVTLYIFSGREDRAAAAARDVRAPELARVLRTEGGRWERAAGLAAIAAVGRRMPLELVAALGPRVIEIAKDQPSSLVAPQPARRAKEALAALLLSMPVEQRAEALDVLRANLETGLPDVQRAVAEALVLATNAGVSDETLALVESFLREPGMSGVSVLWVAERIGSDRVAYEVVEHAALQGSWHAIEAIAASAAGFENERIRAALEEHVAAIVERPVIEQGENQRTVHMVSLEGAGISGRYVSGQLKQRLLRYLLDVATNQEQPELNRFSAANAIHNLGPGLTPEMARETIDALLPLARGDYGPSPLDTPFGGRRLLSRSSLTLGEHGMLRAAALQALGPLLDVVPERQSDIERPLAAAFADGDPNLLEAAFDLLAHTDVHLPPVTLSLALENMSAAVRLAALRWWQHRGDGLPDDATITRALADPNPNVRLVLVRVAMSDAERGQPVLRKIAECDEDSYVRLFAQQRLG